MREIARNQSLVKSLELEDLMSRLDLSKDSADTQRPSYADLYPQGWRKDALAELQHREAVHKIVHWPVDKDNKVNILKMHRVSMQFHNQFCLYLILAQFS